MCTNPVLKRIKNGSIIKFPCGGCMGCRVDSLLLWTARCNSEFVKARSSFVTFTYNDLWYYNNCFPNNKQIQGSLIRSDFSKLIDRLKIKFKRYFNNDFKYFACGEYGDELRCHFHALFFGLDFKEHAKLIKSCWKFGFVNILPILNGGIRYVVDYFTKNQTGDNAIKLYDNEYIERPFKTCSKGLGFDFFFAHADEISKTGCVKIGSRTVFVPTYYNNLFCDFSEDSVDSRLRLRFERFKEIECIGKSFGFPDYNSYIAYLRESKSKSLESQFRNKGISVNPYDSLKTSFDTKSLVSEVNNILLKECLI